MITTTNGAKKFEATDNVTIANLNANADVIDAHIASGGSSHAAATTSTAGFMSASDKTKLNGLTNYTHPTGDGNQHVPPTGTTNNGKVLKAGATAGSAAWGTVAFSEIGSKPTTLNGYGITDATPTRINNGMFEFWNGTEWVAVGGNVVKNVGVADYLNSAAVANTYYTAVNITGRGKLFGTSVYIAPDNASYYRIRITIDGGTPYIINNSGSVPTSRLEANNGSSYSITWRGEVDFNTSLLVEFMKNNTSSSQVLQGSVDYGLA